MEWGSIAELLAFVSDFYALKTLFSGIADTSRPIRQGEVDGDGYWFITRDEVRRLRSSINSRATLVWQFARFPFICFRLRTHGYLGDWKESSADAFCMCGDWSVLCTWECAVCDPHCAVDITQQTKRRHNWPRVGSTK